MLQISDIYSIRIYLLSFSLVIAFQQQLFVYMRQLVALSLSWYEYCGISIATVQ